jgi:AcrR family transcriptional regulator
MLRTAYDLFSRRGLSVGIDRIIASARVAKMTLYRNFGSRDELLLAVFARREERWTYGWLLAEAERRGGNAEERLLALFDVLDEWFQRDDYEGCLFTNALIEVHDTKSPIGAASVRFLANIRGVVQRFASEAHVRDPGGFARQWQMLMMGSIVAAMNGDTDAAVRARDIGVLLLERERSRGGR